MLLKEFVFVIEYLDGNDVFYSLTWKDLDDEVLKPGARLKYLKFNMSHNFFDLDNIRAAITKLLDKLRGLAICKLVCDIDYKTMQLAFR